MVTVTDDLPPLSVMLLTAAFERGRRTQRVTRSSTWGDRLVVEVVADVLHDRLRELLPRPLLGTEAVEAATRVRETLHGLALLHGADPETLTDTADRVLRDIIRGAAGLEGEVGELVAQLHRVLLGADGRTT